MNQRLPAFAQHHGNAGCAGVDGVFNQFLDRRRRPLDHLARGDPVDKDGVEAARDIREHERATGKAPARLVALTADALTHQVAAYLEGDFDAHVAKPIAANELFGAIGLS